MGPRCRNSALSKATLVLDTVSCNTLKATSAKPASLRLTIRLCKAPASSAKSALLSSAAAQRAQARKVCASGSGLGAKSASNVRNNTRSANFWCANWKDCNCRSAPKPSSAGRSNNEALTSSSMGSSLTTLVLAS